MALTVSWKSFCIRPSSMGASLRLFAQLLVDRVDGAVDLSAHAGDRAVEVGLGLEDLLGAALDEGALGLVDLLAVAGDLGDEPIVQGPDLVGRLDCAQVADDLVDRAPEAFKGPLVLLGRARRGDLARQAIEGPREVVLRAVDRVDVVVGGLGVSPAAGGDGADGYGGQKREQAAHRASVAIVVVPVSTCVVQAGAGAGW